MNRFFLFPLRRLLRNLAFHGGMMALCWIFFLPVNAHAEKFTLHYAMYAGGFQAMTLQMDFDFSTSQSTPSYQATMQAKPYGLLGHLLPWAGEYRVTGITHDGLFYPLTHIKVSQWREDMDQYDMVYRDRTLISVKKQEKEKGQITKTDMVLDPELHQSSVDIMTAAMRVMQQLQHHGNCHSSSFVFDGKRRFRFDFTDHGTENLTTSRYNIFSGTAHLCKAEMFPLKGYGKKPRGYYKIQESARKRGSLPQIWFGKIDRTQNRFVPVKMMVHSEYGAILVHLQKIIYP